MNAVVSTRTVLVLAVALTAVVAAVALTVQPTPRVTESTYHYSVSLATNATLANVTLLLPLPTDANGSTPVAAAVRNGPVTAPEGWRVDVVETDSGQALRVEADTVVADRRPDGRRYSVYRVDVETPAGHAVNTADPFGREPTVADGDPRERPCPNVVVADPDQRCYDFDAEVSAAYGAPATAEVSLRLIHAGANTYDPPAGEPVQFSERVTAFLDGPQDGWVDANGFASTEPGP